MLVVGFHRALDGRLSIRLLHLRSAITRQVDFDREFRLGRHVY